MEKREKNTNKIKKAWEKLYEKDLPIIGGFLNEMKFNTTYRLYFKDGTELIAYYDFCADGDNDLELDDPDYEDLYEFYFKVKKIEKKGTELKFKRNKWIVLNYHNFPIKFELYQEEANPEKRKIVK